MTDARSQPSTTEAHLRDYIRKLEYDNEQAAARIMALEAELRGVAQTPSETASE